MSGIFRTIIFNMSIVVNLTSVADATWGGFYGRGGLGSIGYSQIRTLDHSPTKGDFVNITALVELAMGWGTVLNESIYLGIDGQIGNIGIFYYGRGGASYYWSPNLQGRVGLPLATAMPYIAGGFGYINLISRTVAGKDPEPAVFTWSLRVGCDAKISENIFLGVYGQMVRNFDEVDQSTNIVKGSYGFSEGGLMGYQF